MSQSIIRKELQTRLKAWADSHVPPLPVALEGVEFKKPNEDSSLPKNPFVECFLMPTATLDPTVDGKRRREVGLFQVNIWYPDGRGTGAIEACAESLVDAFPVVPKVGDVSVERTPSLARSYAENDWRVIPVTIQYRYESLN